MEENRGLRWLIQQEGALQNFRDASPDVLVVSAKLEYQEGMNLVLDLYKPAARCRQTGDENVNFNAGSLQGFLSFIQACEDAVSRVMNPIIQALLLHNAGSASAPRNGNTSSQNRYNLRARDLLLSVPDTKEERTDDWWSVYEKVSVGLYEPYAIPFNEADYRGIIKSMFGRSKDCAGRCEFLANWLESQGRHDEALEILRLVESDTTSDPTQVARALDTLKRLTSVLTMLFFLFAPIFLPRIATAIC